MKLLNYLSRRDFLKLGSAGMASMAGAVGLSGLKEGGDARPVLHSDHGHNQATMGTVGEVDHIANGFDPHELLYDFDFGEVKEEAGRTVREWNVTALDLEFEIAPGVFFPGWVYGTSTSAASRRNGRLAGQCPGPTFRCVEGEWLSPRGSPGTY